MSRRYILRSPTILRWVMDHPGRGVPYSVRTLAEASGCKRGLIEKLLSRRQKTADMEDAQAVVEALGVTLNVLFAPPVSPDRDNLNTNRHRQEE